jgi:hypothetical protein
VVAEPPRAASWQSAATLICANDAPAGAVVAMPRVSIATSISPASAVCLAVSPIEVMSSVSIAQFKAMLGLKEAKFALLAPVVS